MRKDNCSVYTINGFMRGKPGSFRIIVLAADKDAAIDFMGFRDHIASSLVTISRDTKDWVQYDESTSIGDIFVVPLGTHRYLPVDPDEIEL